VLYKRKHHGISRCSQTTTRITCNS